MIKNILFPTDFSQSAECALPHALEISRKLDAKITILHIRTPFEDDPSRPEIQFFDEGKYEAYVEEQLIKASEVLPPEHRVETVSERSISTAPGILEFASKGQCDLIVMGTHGRSGLSHFFLGSVAEKVVRHAKCPVLTVASRRKEYRSSPDYKKILITFDFSENSKDAVRRGYEFAKAYQCHVEVLYVVEQVMLPPYDEIWQATVKGELPEVRRSAQRILEEALGKRDFKDLRLTVQVGDADGKAEKEIVEYAQAEEFDLIVMGTHGLSGIDHALLGSTTERVIRTAPCPVLTFHRPIQEKAST